MTTVTALHGDRSISVEPVGETVLVTIESPYLGDFHLVALSRVDWDALVAGVAWAPA